MVDDFIENFIKVVFVVVVVVGIIVSALWQAHREREIYDAARKINSMEKN